MIVLALTGIGCIPGSWVTNANSKKTSGAPSIAWSFSIGNEVKLTMFCRRKMGNPGKREMGKARGIFTSLGTLSWGSVRIGCLPGRAEYTVGNKNLLTLGLFPGQGSFWVCWCHQQRERKKITLKWGEQKEPPKKTRDSIKKGKSRKGRMILSSNAESTLTDKHFWALSSLDLATIVTTLLCRWFLLT